MRIAVSKHGSSDHSLMVYQLVSDVFILIIFLTTENLMVIKPYKQMKAC